MIYFDYSATTPIDPRVLELMTEVHANAIGNPSSVHRFGQKARSTVERARRQISSAVGCDPTEIIFTGSGSEANNLVLRNLLYGEKQHVVLSSIEHPSIYNTVKELEPLGITNTVVDVDGAGRVNPDEVLNAIQEETGLVSIMMVNNEVGTVEPIADMANECKNRNIPFHSDGVQALGKIPLDVKELGVTSMSFSAHKLYGPQGVGILYLSGGEELHPLIAGGSQENGRRAGTENVAGISGFGLAAELAAIEVQSEMERLSHLRESFTSIIKENRPEVIINGHPSATVPGVMSLSIPGISAEKLVMKLDMDGFAVSAGAACASGSPKPSPVLKAIGLSNELNRQTIRISFGRFTTTEEVDSLVNTLLEYIPLSEAEMAV